MKRLFCTFLVVFILFTLLSCNKKSELSPLVGFWDGSYKGAYDEDIYDWAVLFRRNGTVRVFSGSKDTTSVDNSKIATGTYTVSEDSVTVNYVFPGDYDYTFKGVLITDNIFPELEGVWNSNDGIYGGEFIFYKKD